MTLMWSEKHRPRSVQSMVGNEAARAAVVSWFSKWRPGTKPLLLSGPPGVGKTTIARVASEYFGYDMIDINASDARSKSRINEVLQPALGNLSVMGRPMIFIDEVDGMDRRRDFGGVAALAAILKEPTVPIILAANDATADKMKPIVKASKTIEFKKIPLRLLKMHLERIAKAEGASLGPASIIKTVGKSNGDIRHMINMAQSQATGFDPRAGTSPQRIPPEDAVKLFFKAESEDQARGILYLMDADPRTRIDLFYSSIISSGLDSRTLAQKLDVISQADVLYGRILRYQNWDMLRYLNNILLGLYEKDLRITYARYNLPWPLVNRIRFDRPKIRSFSLELAQKLHMSASAFASICMPYALRCVRNGTLDLEPDADQGELIRKEAARAR